MSVVVLTFAALTGLACEDHRRLTGPTPASEAAPVVSDPAPAIQAASYRRAAAGGWSFGAATAPTEVVYVSLPPGSVPDGVAAIVRNARTGAVATAFMADGGFDPVPIEGAAGDRLEFEIRTGANDSPVLFERSVPEKRRPVVVRTNPPRGKRDVPLNATIIIVFSEPMDPTTLTSETVQLRARVGPARLSVPGRLEFHDANNLILAFLPAGSLRADVDFEFVITTAAHDADGDALEAPFTLQFTTARGNAQAANLIAFTSELHRSPGSEIYLIAPDGKDLRRLTYGQSWGSSDPSWSPDGKRIAFASDRHRALRDRQDGRIYVMNADGSGVTRLTSDWWGGKDQSPAWSPDGARIAFARGECFAFDDLPILSFEPERACVTEGGPAIYLMRADGSGATRLAEGSSPSWSPDGSKIAFVRWSGDQTSDIYVMNDDGSEVARLTSSPPGVSAPAWSPDGTRIAFAGGPDESTKSDLYVINSDGSGLRRLTRGGGESPTSPTWSPDGSRIAYAAGVPGTGRMGIFVTNADGRSPATYLGVEGYGPVWAPSGVVAPPRPLPTVSMSMQRPADNNGDQQIDTVLAPVAEPLRVQVLRNGGPAEGVLVSWKIRGDLDGSSLSAATTTTDAAGVASVALKLGSRARGYVVEASVPGTTGSPVVFTATARPGNPVALAIRAGNGQVGLPGRELRDWYYVRVSDAHGNEVKGISIDWAVATGGGQIRAPVYRSETTIASHVLGPEIGPQTVTARATAIPGAPQVTFSSAAGDAVVDVGTPGDTGGCDLGFKPSDVTVSVGSTVAWGWIFCHSEDPPHDLTFEDDTAEPVSSRAKNGGYHLRTFTVPGTYRYRCTLHSTSYTEGEVGTVRVQ